jgi:hypothetical protein
MCQTTSGLLNPPRMLLYVSSHSQVPMMVPPHRFPVLPVNDKPLDQLILDQTKIRVDAMNPPKRREIHQWDIKNNLKI